LADDATAPVPLDDEARALKLQQAKAEARKAILDANLASAQALVPTIDTSALKETVSLEGEAGSVVNTVAAGQLKKVADAIVKIVGGKAEPGSRVILVEGRAVAEADLAYTDIVERFRWYEDKFDEVIQQVRQPAEEIVESLITLLIGASTVVSAVTSTLGLLASDTSMRDRKVALDDTALKAALAGRLKAAGLEPVIEGLTSTADSEVMRRLSGLWDRYAELKRAKTEKQLEIDDRKAEQAAIDARIASVQADYDKARKDGDEPTARRLATYLEELRKERVEKGFKQREKNTIVALEAATWLMSMFDAYAAAISTLPAGAARSPLQAAALREVVHGRKAGEHLLFATITAAGGDAIQKQSNALGLGARTTFMAGVVVTWMLIAADGKLVAADVESRFGEEQYRF
jgi:hypothetical protein